MIKLNLGAINALVIKVSFGLLAVAGVIAFSSSATAKPKDLFATDAVAGSILAFESDGTATTFASGLTDPQGIALDKFANVYVCEGTSGDLVMVSPDGTMTVIASSLSNPIGVAFVAVFSDNFDLLVAENGANAITKVSPSGIKTPFITVTAPVAVAVGINSGNVFVTHGTFVSTYGSNGIEIGTPVDVGSNTRGVAVVEDSSSGTLQQTIFVTTDANTIMKISPDGTVEQFATGTTLQDPNGLAFLPALIGGGDQGNILAADSGAGNILQFTKMGEGDTFGTFGNPNFIAFEKGFVLPTPTPTPTPTVSPTVTPTPTPTPTPSDKALNLSTRVDVQTGTNVGIGGFIITGTDPKLVVIRAIGPSLADFGVVGALADPVLELHDADQAVIATNDDWMNNTSEDQAMLVDHSLAPTNDFESAIIKTLDPGLYTAVVSGNSGGTGVALIELYDLDDPGVAGEMGNISTRGFVGTGASVMIGGLIVGPEDGLDAAVVVRAIGPSLANFGVADPLADPVLELRNGDGDLIAMNDNWETDLPPNNYAAEVMAAGLAPSDASESAVFANLTNGLYTAIVSGKDDTTGVGLVEVYHVATQTANSAGH
jgi:hypothetical protein